MNPAIRRSLVVSTLLLLAGSLQAAESEDVRGVALRQQGLKVIDEKCLVCHNRQRIEDAVKERKNMEKITQLMEKQGAALTDKERQVMNHFWNQKLFRTRDEAGTRQQHEGTAPSLK